MSDKERTAIARGSGKWGDPTVPKTGWHIMDVVDLKEDGADPDEADMTCQMCEYMHIRYVHHMAHAKYPEILGCGCICAGHMSEDMLGAKEQQRRAENRTRTRLREAKKAAEAAAARLAIQAEIEAKIAAMTPEQRAQREANLEAQRRRVRAFQEGFDPVWRQAYSGNWWTPCGPNMRLIVYADQRHGGWKFNITDGENVHWVDRRFNDADKAKQAAEKLIIDLMNDAIDLNT